MRLLRHRLFIAIISLSVLAGYSHQVLADCDGPEEPKTTQTGKSSLPEPVKNSSDGCQCLCHKASPNAAITVVSIPAPELKLESPIVAGGVFPPLIDPDGIDHPPQLG